MKKIIRLPAVILFFAFINPFQQSNFHQLHSLTGGDWVMKTKNGFLIESWDKINDSLLRNQAFKVTGIDTLLLEHVELNRKGTDISYISFVANENNGKSVVFKLIESKNGQFIFSNPMHDFPQRIVYHFISKDSLHAWIDGKLNGKEVKKDFYYTRIYSKG